MFPDNISNFVFIFLNDLTDHMESEGWPHTSHEYGLFETFTLCNCRSDAILEIWREALILKLNFPKHKQNSLRLNVCLSVSLSVTLLYTQTDTTVLQTLILENICVNFEIVLNAGRSSSSCLGARLLLGILRSSLAERALVNRSTGAFESSVPLFFWVSTYLVALKIQINY